MRMGLVGVGRWGRFILRDLVSLGCDVVAVARTDESRSRATEGGAIDLVREVADLHGVAGVVVATPTSTHAAVVADALRIGVPVFVEKPLTDDPASAEDLAADGGDRLFVMDKWRYHPGVEAIAGLAASGQYGKLRGIRTRRLSWGHSHSDVDAVWVLLPHDLAIVLEIAGLIPEVACASGLRGAGMNAHLTAILGPEPACILEVSSMSPFNERRIVVTFEEATVALDGGYPDRIRLLHHGSTSTEEKSIPIPPDLPLFRELAAFVGYLQGDAPPRSSAAEGALIVRRIAEARSSMDPAA
jgi:predicted dehydrogenase